MYVTIMPITVKVSESKLRPFEHAQSMFKQPTGLVYIDNIVNYLSYLPYPFLRGLEVDLEGSNTLLTLTISMYIDRLDLVSTL